MDSAAMISEARRITGLVEFDSESFREGLDIVSEHLAAAPAFTDAGRRSVAGIAIGFLANRLRVADYARRHPEVLERPIERPLVILGVPRTGTTMLSHLLSVDPDRRSLLHWEAFDSVPPPTQETLRTDPRCLAMKAADNSSMTAPSEIHVLEADLPTECIIAQAHDFKSILWYGIAENPLYTQWLLHGDMTSAYRYHKLQLQVLQSRTRGRWALKAPAHGLAIRTLRKTYPDARIIWAHRDPYQALSSACSFISASRRSFATVDEQALGAGFLELFKQHLERPMAFHAQEGPDSIYNLHYATFLRAPIAEIRRLYAWLGDPFTEQVEDNMKRWLARNQKGKRGEHSHTLERFGLSAEMLRPHFQTYVDRYQVATGAWR